MPTLAWLGAGYWSVDAKAETAMGGTWKKGPGAGLFKSLNDVSTPLSQRHYVSNIRTPSGLP